MRNYIIALSLFIAIIFVLAFAIGQDDGNVVVDSDEGIEIATDTIDSIDNDIDFQDSMVNSSSFDSSAIEIPVSTKSIPEQMLVRVSYTTSYNKETKCPNWVAWRLERDRTDGPVRRDGVPYYDEDLNIYGIGKVTDNLVSGCYIVDLESGPPRQELSDWYKKPPYTDHGHICPAADNKWSKAAMNQSFLLTNMCPQDRGLNSGDWAGLEKKSRGWAKRFGEIYIVAGPIFYNGISKSMGDNEVGIPDAFFKVILRLEKEPKAIGFVFPNNGIHHDLKDYMKSVNEVEEITGFNFFHNLPDEIENEIEKNCNKNEW